MDIKDVKVGQRLRTPLYGEVEVTAIGHRRFLAVVEHFGEIVCWPNDYEPADCLYVVLVKSGKDYEIWDEDGVERGVSLDEAKAITGGMISETQIVRLEEHMV